MLAGVVPEWARRRDDLAVSLNLERRHLDESQRAMVAARLATLRKGGDAGKPAGGNAQNCALVSQPEAADRLSVSRRTVQYATSVKDDPVLAPAVEQGTITVADATGGRWRACHSHHAADTVCAGFYARRGADCSPIQIAERFAAAGFGRIVRVE